MRRYILFLLACSLAFSLAAQQTENESKAVQQWAFNANALFGGNTDIGMPVIAYKKVQDTGDTFRFGLGGFYEQTSEIDYNINLSLGYEKQRQLSPNWITSYGFDFIFNAGKNLSDADREAGSMTMGALWSIQWMITPKVGIYTESGIYHTFTTNGEGSSILLHHLRIVPPQSLFIAVRF